MLPSDDSDHNSAGTRQHPGAADDPDRLVCLPVEDIHPAKQNDAVYRPISTDDPGIQKLVGEIEKHGLLEPLTITQDRVILSGHRRFAAAKLAGLQELPVRFLDIRSDDPRFLQLLVSFNTQRLKTIPEQLREESISADPEESYQALLAHRRARAEIAGDFIELRGTKNRKEISSAKSAMARAIRQVVNERREFWPITVRSIHYALLNIAPARNTLTGEPYVNSKQCYQDLCDLAARMRLCGWIPFASICDETRPVYEWDVHAAVGPFVRREMAQFLKGYRRDLQQSQPNHIEVVVEKNSVLPMLRDVVSRYGITLTSGRGYSSLEPRRAMAKRFINSGREQLIVIVVSDFDPEGEDIPHSFALSMRDDFGIESVRCLKATLTFEQVSAFSLPSALEAKESSARYKQFVRKYGTRAVELEALQPRDLQKLVRDAVDGVMDIAAFNRELEQEKQDAAYLAPVRRQVNELLQSLANDIAQ